MCDEKWPKSRLMDDFCNCYPGYMCKNSSKAVSAVSVTSC